MAPALRILKALADGTRLRIVDYIGTGERCVCEIVPFARKSQPNVSLHLKKLVRAGVLSSRRDGQRIFYRVKDRRVISLLRMLRC